MGARSRQDTYVVVGIAVAVLIIALEPPTGSNHAAS
jgi:hypothetical protein